MNKLLGILLCITAFLQAQHAPNIAIYKQCIDSAVIKAHVNRLSSEKPEIEITVPQHAAVIETDVRQAILFQLSLRSRIQFENKKEKLHFVIEQADLNYPEVFRDGFLGEYYFVRKIDFKGSVAFVTKTDQEKTDFSFSFTDTLKLAQKDSIETSGYILTQKNLPTEPVFLSIWEPLTVVAALAITAYLFFTTRSAD